MGAGTGRRVRGEGREWGAAHPPCPDTIVAFVPCLFLVLRRGDANPAGFPGAAVGRESPWALLAIRWESRCFRDNMHRFRTRKPPAFPSGL